MSEEERYLIECLAEECAETIKACMKALRFGPNNRHPNYPTFTNAQEIVAEFQEAAAIFEALVERKVFQPTNFNNKGKLDRALRWLEMRHRNGGSG